MSNIDKRALREAANAASAASWGNWESYKPHKGARGYEVKVGVKAVAQHCLKVDSEFIAAANPATVLALLDELEAAEKRIAEQREYYEGVISDGGRRIAKLEARDETKFVKCWSCKHDIEVLEIVDCDGYCPRCASPIDLDDEPYAGIGVKGE